MPKYAAKADRNQSEVTAALRAAGWDVRHTHTLGQGFPDLVAARNRFTVLVEVKMPGQKLTDPESRFHSFWAGAVVIVYSGQDAIDKCELARREYKP